MAKYLSGLLAFNIVFIPILIFLHFQGECKILDSFLLDAFPNYCEYVNNVWLNILYANIIMMIAGLVSGGKGVAGKTPTRLPSGGSSGSSSGPRSGSSDSSRPKH